MVQLKPESEETNPLFPRAADFTGVANLNSACYWMVLKVTSFTDVARTSSFNLKIKYV